MIIDNNMIEYSIIFERINKEKNCFYYRLNSNENKRVILRVYNSYLGYKEYEVRLDLTSGVEYWTYIPSNNKNRYVEFRDEDTLDVVGLFGLDGNHSLQEIDNQRYVKRIFQNLTKGEKWNLYTVFNEIGDLNIYNNDFIDVEENDVVVDIGFNFGLFSVLSLKKNPSRIIAFEPNKRLVNIFRENFKSDKIELFQVAVSNKNGTTIFYENSDTGMSTIMNSMTTDVNDEYNVDVINFNDFIINHNLEKIDYLKVDCEGAEYDIFESISNEYLSNNIKKMAIEFHNNLQDIKVQTLINKLQMCGFKLKIISDENLNLGLIYAKK